MKYPTLEEVEDASREQLGIWWRFLSSPGWDSTERPQEEFIKIMDTEAVIMDRISARFNEMGMLSPEISKAIGWDPQKYK